MKLLKPPTHHESSNQESNGPLQATGPDQAQITEEREEAVGASLEHNKLIDSSRGELRAPQSHFNEFWSVSSPMKQKNSDHFAYKVTGLDLQTGEKIEVWRRYSDF